MKQKIEYKWDEIDTHRLNFIQTKFPDHFNFIQQFPQNVANGSNQNLQKYSSLFRKYYTKTKYCNKKSNYHYHCVECYSNRKVGVCIDCFDFQYHKNHTYFIFKNNDKQICDCGFQFRVKPEASCKYHQIKNQNQNQLKQQQKPLTQDQSQLFKSFFIILFKKLIKQRPSFTTIFSYKYCNNFIFELLTKLNQNNYDYNKLTVEVFAQPYQQNNKESILRKIMTQTKYSSISKLLTFQLFSYLNNVQSFGELFCQNLILQSVDKNLGSFDVAFQDIFNKLFFDDYYTHKKLGEKGIILSHGSKIWSEAAKQAIKLYSHMKITEKSRVLLIPVWKHIIQNTELINRSIQMCFQDKNGTLPYFIFLSFCINNDQLMKKLVNKFIIYFKHNRQSKFQSYMCLYNEFVKIVLEAAKGNNDKFVQYFEECNIQKLNNFVAQYFMEIFQYNKKCKFNKLTANCLFLISKRYNLNKLYSFKPQITALQFSKILVVAFRNILAYNYQHDLTLYKIAKYQKQQNLLQQKIKSLTKWFHQFFCMRQQIPRFDIIRYRLQGIFDFQQTKDIILNYSTYNSTTKMFQYKGPQVIVSPEILLTYIERGQQIYGIQYDGQNNQNEMFYSKQNSQLISAIFNRVFQKIDISSYSSYNKKDRYLICLTAVIYNFMVKGQNKQVKQYIQKLRQASERMRKTNLPVDRLLKINNYRVKEAKQQKQQQIKIQQKVQQQQQKNQQNIQIIQAKETLIKELKQEGLHNIEQVEKESQKIEKIQEKVQQVEKDNIKLKSQKINVGQQQQQKKQKQQQFKVPKQQQQQQIVVQQIIERIPSHRTKQKLKKLQKINKIKQRYTKKRQNYSHHFLPQPSQKLQQNSPDKNENKTQIATSQSYHQQTCLVCKQTLTDYSFLYYYARIRQSPIYNLYTKNIKKQYSLNSCFHAIHQTCVNKNNKKCILCTNEYDLLIPVINKNMNEQQKYMLVNLWYGDQFKQYYMQKVLNTKVNKNKNTYFNYNSTNTTTTNNSTDTNNKIQKYKLYMYLLQSYITTLTITILIPSSILSSSVSLCSTSKLIQSYAYKNNKYIKLLKQLYQTQDKTIKQSILAQIYIYITNQQQNKNKYVGKIHVILANIILHRIDPTLNKQLTNKIQKYLIKQLQELKIYKQYKYSQQLLYHILSIAGLKQVQQISQIISIYNSNSDNKKGEYNIIEYWQELGLLAHVPQTAQQLLKMRQYCPKCNIVSSYLCIVCNKVLCKNCNKINNHLNSNNYYPYNYYNYNNVNGNGNKCICIDIDDGCIYALQSNNSVRGQCAYYDMFGDDYKQYKQQFKHYRLDITKVYHTFRKII